MNPYDHEDAFKDANRCAGRTTQLAEALKQVETQTQARTIILDCQNQYEALFNAFIEGVEYGRKNPRSEHAR